MTGTARSLPRSPRHHRGLLLLTAALFALVLACAPAPEPPPPQETASESPPVRSYPMRGVIEELPDPADPRTALKIHHEAVREWVGYDGTVGVMSAMAMPFAVDEEVSLEDLAVGDKIAFTLEVDWEADQPALVTQVEKLPADTELDFSVPPPPDGEPDEAPAEGEE